MNGYARPVGTAQRPGSGIGTRSGSRAGQRAGSLGRTQPLIGAGVLPGTARPGTRGGPGGAGALASIVHVSDRPVTRQGLSGIKTAAQGPHRQVQDKSYWLGMLRSKISELSNELAKINKETNQLQQEGASYVTYEKRAENLAAEMKESQGKLADYNMLIDRMNTNSGFDDLKEEYEVLKEQNAQEARVIDELFATRQEREKEIKRLEVEIDQERRMTDSLVADMQPGLRTKYAQLKNMSMALQADMEKKQQSLDTLNDKIQRLEEEVSHSPAKQEAVSLHEKINELEEKRDSLLREQELPNKLTPQEERERLLQQVKDDNQEVARMENRINELQSKLETVKEEISQLDMDIEESQGEQAIKYKELKKRDETMQEYMDKFEELKASEIENVKQAQQEVVTLLERTSRAMVTSKHLPSAEDYEQMKDDLEFKENEMNRSKETSKGLDSEHARLRMDVEKVEMLEKKITDELEDLKESVATMTKELETYKNIDGLKRDGENRKKHLHEEKTALLDKKDSRKEEIKALTVEVEKLKEELNQNETYVQLGNLERKWQHLEQNNYSLKEYINQRSAESDYETIKLNVNKSISILNKNIIKALNKPKSLSGR